MTEISQSNTATEAKHTEKCKHSETPLKIGKYTIWLGAGTYLTEAVKKYTLISLNGYIPDIYEFGDKVSLIYAELQDYGGVPEEWPNFINDVVKLVKDKKKVLGFCTGGHGRTGTFAASMVARLAPDIDDPIQYVRDNYCTSAVETAAQATAVFDLLGKKAPEKYLLTLRQPKLGFSHAHSVGTVSCPCCRTACSEAAYKCYRCGEFLDSTSVNELSVMEPLDKSEYTMVQCDVCGDWTDYNKEFCKHCNNRWWII